MDAFRKNYNFYYKVLRLTGLWPFSNSLPTKIQRVALCVIILWCMGIQLKGLTTVNLSIYNLLTMLSYFFPMMLYLVRYIGFICNFSSIRSIFENIGADCCTLKNPIEVELLMKHIRTTRKVFLTYLGFSCLGIFFMSILLLTPTLLVPKYQIRALRMVGFFFDKNSTQLNWICVHVTVVTAIGLLGIACTEVALSVFSFYLCGLFDIASYRIRTAINNGVKLATSNPIDIRPTVIMHEKALRIANEISTVMVLPYLLAIIVVVVSFAISLCRLSSTITEMAELDNIVISIVIVLIHLIIMFLNNYSGQQMMNSSLELFDAVWNSLWYEAPMNTQKMVLYILMRTSTEVQFSLAGLFIPSIGGFSTMISSSFSYFTVLYSVQ